MSLSEKQRIANRQNAQKSTGPKTADGKAITARNSLKHGLLAREAVITEGDGAEDQRTFDTLVSNLVEQFEPVGSLEEMLVEKIAVSYWRLRRANRYEVGVLRQKLDTVTDDYYDTDENLTDAQINEKIASMSDQCLKWSDRLNCIKTLHDESKDLSELYDFKENWQWTKDAFLKPQRKVYKVDGKIAMVVDLTPVDTPEPPESPEDIRKKLNEKGHTDDTIWQMHSDLCQEHIDEYRQKIEELQKDKVKNKLRIQVNKKCAALPGKCEMDNLLRYETAIERQLYKAINQLERLQRLRAGDHVPPPVQVDVNTLGTGELELSKTEP